MTRTLSTWLALGALLCGAAGACTEKPPGAPPSGKGPRSAAQPAATPAAMPAAAPGAPRDAAATRPRPGEPPPGAGRFRCEKDADCVPTCALGAVSFAWWKRHGQPWIGCEDGCASKGYFARCEKGACTTWRKRGGPEERVPACTNQPLPPLPRRPRPVE